MSNQRQQKENWQLNPKDSTGMYCLQRMAWGWRTNSEKNPAEYFKTFTVSVFFDKIHEYPGRYEIIQNNHVVAVVNKLTARINNLSKIEPEDLQQQSENVPTDSSLLLEHDTNKKRQN